LGWVHQKISPYPSLRKRGVEKIGEKLYGLFPLLLAELISLPLKRGGRGRGFSSPPCVPPLLKRGEGKKGLL
jgi:hypothetical protein